MVENKSETAGDLSGILSRFESGEKITEDEAISLIRDGYFPTASEGVKIILEKIGINDESDENELGNKLRDLPREYMRILRHFLGELLEEEGKIDSIMAIEGSTRESKSRRLKTILRTVEENLN